MRSWLKLPIFRALIGSVLRSGPHYCDNLMIITDTYQLRQRCLLYYNVIVVTAAQVFEKLSFLEIFKVLLNDGGLWLLQTRITTIVLKIGKYFFLLINIFVWILWFIQSYMNFSWNARKIGKKHLLPHISWSTSKMGNWVWRMLYEDNTMRLISIITMTFGK